MLVPIPEGLHPQAEWLSAHKYSRHKLLASQTLDQLVVGTLFEPENNLRTVGENRSPYESRFLRHQSDQFSICCLTPEVSVRLGAGTAPREHLVDRRQFAQGCYLVDR
jgi:hypothetical protein